MSKSTIGQVSPGAQADAVHSSVQRFRTTRARGPLRYFRNVGQAEPAARVGTAPFKVQVSKDRIRNGVVSWGRPLFPKPRFVVPTMGALSGPEGPRPERLYGVGSPLLVRQLVIPQHTGAYAAPLTEVPVRRRSDVHHHAADPAPMQKSVKSFSNENVNSSDGADRTKTFENTEPTLMIPEFCPHGTFQLRTRHRQLWSQGSHSS